MRSMTLLFTGAMALAAAAVGAQTPQTQPQQKPAAGMQQAEPSKQAGQQVTITGCLRQTADDPKIFALVDAKPSQQSGAQMKPGEQRPGTQEPGSQKPGEQAAGTTGRAMQSPFFRLEDMGTPGLKQHVDKRVEITGTIIPAKDEKGADIVTVTKEQAPGVTATTIRAVDLKPVPTLNIKSVKATGECPAAKR